MKNYVVNVEVLNDLIYFNDEERSVYDIITDMLDAWRDSDETDILKYEILEYSETYYFVKIYNSVTNQIEYWNIDIYEED